MKSSFLKPSSRFPYLWLLCLFLLVSGCARNASCERKGSTGTTQQPGAAALSCGTNSTRVIFKFSVQGKLALNNPNVTYYIVINAPDDQPKQTLDPATQGPRINGPSLDFPPSIIQGRLPFIGLLPGDVESKWTDFYFLSGGTLGSGIRRPDGTPEIVQRNIPQSLWKLIDDSTVEIQLDFKDIFADQTLANIPANIVVNLATSDNIDNGQGFVYDHWRANLPFQILTAPNNTPQRDTDTNNQLIMRQIPGKVLPQLPQGVDGTAVNIVSYEYRVVQL
ncbi:MAG: hypothetical protein ACAI44_00635 [Candidatus Sericytochromatia bacterium]